VYRQTLPGIKFSGPTHFGPILETFLGHCRKQQGGAKPTNYNVLLILTDGTIHDMLRTKQLIVELSTLPAQSLLWGWAKLSLTICASWMVMDQAKFVMSRVKFARETLFSLLSFKRL